MRYDANYYKPENFAPKLESLINDRYSHISKAHRNTEFCRKYNDTYSNSEGTLIDSTFRQWTSWVRVPSVEKLINICELLDCDIDYFLSAQKEFRKDVSSAAETTGLNYKTIETLKTIKNAPARDTNNIIDKCILFLLDFLIQQKKGRWILWNIFQYLFKNYNGIRNSLDGSGSNTIELEDGSGIPYRNTRMNVGQTSEAIFYSNIVTGIATIKVEENTQSADISLYEYAPDINAIDADIEKLHSRKTELHQQNFDHINPYTPEYALSLTYHDAAGTWKEFPELSNRVRQRVGLDNYQNEEINNIQQKIDELEFLKKQMLRNEQY